MTKAENRAGKNLVPALTIDLIEVEEDKVISNQTKRQPVEGENKETPDEEKQKPEQEVEDNRSPERNMEVQVILRGVDGHENDMQIESAANETANETKDKEGMEKPLRPEMCGVPV